MTDVGDGTAPSSALSVATSSRSSQFYALFMFAFTSKLWAGVIAQQYKIHYIAYGACAVLAVLCVWQRRFRQGQAFRSELTLFFFFAYMAVSVSWAYSPTTTALSVAIDALYLLVFWIAYVMFLNLDYDQLSRIFEVVPYGVAVVTLWGFITFGRIRQDDSTDAEQLGSISNILAFYLTATVPFLLRNLYLGRGRFTRLVLAATVILTAVLQSRSALAATLLVVLITIADFDRRHRRRVVVVGLAALALAVSAFVVFQTVEFDEGNVLGRLQTDTTFTFADAADELKRTTDNAGDLERRLVWLTAYEGFVDSPYLGVGYGGLGDMFEENFGWNEQSHGFVTTLLSETGLVGTAVFLVVMVAYFRKLARALRSASSDAERKFHQACRASMIGLLIIGLFHQVYQDQIFYILLAWGFAGADPTMQLRRERSAVGSP